MLSENIERELFIKVNLPPSESTKILKFIKKWEIEMKLRTRKNTKSKAIDQAVRRADEGGNDLLY